MNREQLVRLAYRAHLTPRALKAKDPELFKAVAAASSEDLRASLRAQLAGSSDGLRQALDHLEVPLATRKRLRPRDLVLDGLKKAGASADLVAEAKAQVSDLDLAVSGLDKSGSDEPIARNPMLNGRVRQGQMLVLGKMARLSAAKLETLLADGGGPLQIDRVTLDGKVEDGTLSPTQARRLGLQSSLFILLDENLALVDKVNGGDLPIGRVRAEQDLVRVGRAGWAELLGAAETAPPPGLTRDDYAAVLDKRVKLLYPAAALAAQAATSDPMPSNELRSRLQALRTLAAKNPRLFSVSQFSKLDVSGLPAKQVAVLRDHYRRLKAFINRYPGQRLPAFLDDPEVTLDDKVRVTKARTDAARSFFEKNASGDWLNLDLSDGSEDLALLDMTSVPAEERPRVLETARRYQLVHSLASDPDDMGAILIAGYSSAHSIVEGGYERFQATTGFDAPKALRSYAEAMHTMSASTAMVGAMIDVLKGGFNSTAVGNLAPSIQDHIMGIRGYDRLFGSQNFCACEHCNSILGPAAYFVDLMQFAEQHVLEPSFSGHPANHVLHLKTRRPDLWTLELNCANTNTLVPSLAIINRILEGYIATQHLGEGVGDDDAIQDLVYRQTLPDRVDSFGLPFHLPLARIDSYLEHFQRSRAQLAGLLETDRATYGAAKLGLSPRAFQLITTPSTAPSFLRDLFEVDFHAEGDSGRYGPFDAQLLVKSMGLGRDQVGALIGSRFVTDQGANPIRIVGERRAADSVQIDIENVREAEPRSLDRLHRLARLVGHLPWTVDETDFLLARLREAGLPGDLSAPALARLVEGIELKERFDQPLEELCAAFGDIPDRPLEEDGRALFDRLFNPPSFVRLDGAYPKDDVNFHHPALAGASAPSESATTLHRLLGGLRVDGDGLFALIMNLGAALAPAAPGDAGFALSRRNLSLLYRHARLMGQLKLSAEQLFQLIGLWRAGTVSPVAKLDDLNELLAFHDWWKTTKLSLDDLAFITGAPLRDPAAYPDGAAVAQTILASIADERPFAFAGTVFSFAEGVTEEQSQALIEANWDRLEALPDGAGYRLAADFDIDLPLTLPADLELEEPPLRSLLLERHASRVLPAYLAGVFGHAPEKTAALVALSGADLAKADLIQALYGAASPAPLAQVIEGAAPLAVLFADKVFDGPALGFVAAQAAIFDGTGFAAPDLDRVRDVARYRRALGDLRRRKGDPADLHQALGAFSPGQGFDGADQEALARALGVEVGLSRTLQIEIDLPGSALAAFAKLTSCAELARWLGVSGEILPLILSDDYDHLARASDGLLAAMRAKYADEETWREIIEPFDDRIREAKRNALSDYIIESFEQFDSRDDLYAHFLIDISLQGCARTSWVVAASASVQLYLNRVLMNLEQDRRDLSDAQRVHVNPDQIPKAEWAWRKNYRLWEANRKVFLYPESYIEPDLRDNKTALFEALEQSLLQQEVNEQTVLEAYASYLRGFEEIAGLEITGAYHQKDAANESDVLHVFGATQKDPPTFYYRAIRNLYHAYKRPTRGVDWSHWRKLDLQASSRYLSPVGFNGRLYAFWHELATRPRTKLQSGGSKFDGYFHKAKIWYTMAKLDGSWTAPQALGIGDSHPFRVWSEGSLTAQMLGAQSRRPQYSKHSHLEPHDGYTLTGWQWEKLYPTNRGDQVRLGGFNTQFNAPVDLFRNRTTGWVWPFGKAGDIDTALTPYEKMLCSLKTSNGRRVLYYGVADDIYMNHHTHAAVGIEDNRLAGLVDGTSEAELKRLYYKTLYQGAVGILADGTDFVVVNGSFEDAFLQLDGDVLLLQGSVREDRGYALHRIGTTVAEDMARSLFERGVEGLLDIENQKRLGEAPSPVTVLGDRIASFVRSGELDYEGALGVYFREIFFHIPFLVANHLNSQGKFEAAQQWYHFIFDPSATETTPADSTTPGGDRDRLERDRIWQYLEFRGRTLETLNDALTNRAAIEAYKSEPFNPHAIARLRLSAYQKAIVTKYVDNLLDWADRLFARDTREAINEATMLYVLASQILGPRPQQLGPCEAVESKGRSYQGIQALLASEPETVLELEGRLRQRQLRDGTQSGLRDALTLDRGFANDAKLKAEVSLGLQHKTAAARQARQTASDGELARPVAVDASLALTMAAISPNSTAPDAEPITVVSKSRTPRSGNRFEVAAGAGVLNAVGHSRRVAAEVRLDAQGSRVRDGVVNGLNWTELTPTGVWDWRLPGFGISLLRQLAAVFCVPENESLRDYWDRVEDRLYKIRNCMNISGERRQLALFAPPIDPRLLVRAKAAGLSIEDVLPGTSGNLPPYRFVFLIEKAKEYTRTLQSFGSSLLSAIEKKEVEELARLRLVHQDNLSQIVSAVRGEELDHAKEAQKALEKRQATLESRRDHYQALIDEGLIKWENTQAAARHSSSLLYGAASVLDTVAAVAYLVPSVGSPFTFEYGGKEVGDSGTSWAQVLRSTAGVSDAVGSSAGLEASFARREQGWKHQLDQVKLELEDLETQIEAAKIRTDIAEDWKAHHRKSVEQIDEIDEFYRDKFSNLGLYTWLSSSLQRLYRETYNAAYSMARLAEQAFLFERSPDDGAGLRGGYWDSASAGLLAGEQLYMDLQALERRFIETNFRELEIDQSFSLTQIDPAALLTLKQTGACDFAIPEVFFDLFYPGHYRRRIEAVRLTIPCVTGPYSNVSASLSLTASQIRQQPKLGPGFLLDVPKTRSVAIAASSAQNDAGVFEFSFRDERYMPFEGAGAVSQWQLRLPKTFRPFDYDTINDVILSISYSAESDRAFGEEVERETGAIEGALVQVLQDRSLGRLFSLRQEFSTAYHMLLASPLETVVTLKLDERHLPIFLQGKAVRVENAALIVQPAPGHDPGALTIAVNGRQLTGFTPDPRFGDLPALDLGSVFSAGIVGEHDLLLVDPGDLGPEGSGSDPASLAAEKVSDVYIHIAYRLA